MTEARMAAMRTHLEAAFGPSRLEIEDDGHLHVGHAGARDGRGHFTVRIESEKFSGLRPLARHRLVYAALAEMMHTDIHALRVIASTPDEKA